MEMFAFEVLENQLTERENLGLGLGLGFWSMENGLLILTILCHSR